jgi:hypothetical protein
MLLAKHHDQVIFHDNTLMMTPRTAQLRQLPTETLQPSAFLGCKSQLNGIPLP